MKVPVVSDLNMIIEAYASFKSSFSTENSLKNLKRIYRQIEKNLHF